MVLSSDQAEADIATVKVMPKDQRTATDLSSRIASSLRMRIGINFTVDLVPPGTLEHSEFKARRWIDERHR